MLLGKDNSEDTLESSLPTDKKTPTIILGQACLGALLRNNFSAGGSFFYLQLELLCLQLIFFAYNPLGCFLDALSHCKQKNSNCKQKSSNCKLKKPPDTAVRKKLSCKQEASNCKQKSCIPSPSLQSGLKTGFCRCPEVRQMWVLTHFYA